MAAIFAPRAHLGVYPPTAFVLAAAAGEALRLCLLNIGREGLASTAELAVDLSESGVGVLSRQLGTATPRLVIPEIGASKVGKVSQGGGCFHGFFLRPSRVKMVFLVRLPSFFFGSYTQGCVGVQSITGKFGYVSGTEC